jgi:hypothetical protein
VTTNYVERQKRSPFQLKKKSLPLKSVKSEGRNIQFRDKIQRQTILDRSRRGGAANQSNPSLQVKASTAGHLTILYNKVGHRGGGRRTLMAQALNTISTVHEQH